MKTRLDAMTTTDYVIRRARLNINAKHAMDSSARLCLSDAVALANNGDYDGARIRALKSIAYSVGILHPDYQDNL